MNLYVVDHFMQHGIFSHLAVDGAQLTLCQKDVTGMVDAKDLRLRQPSARQECTECQRRVNELIAKEPVSIRCATSVWTIGGEVLQRYIEGTYSIGPDPYRSEPDKGPTYCDADRLRDWMGALDLSDVEAAAALNLGNPGVAIREYKRGKPIGGPALRLMAVTTALVIAIADLRKGQPGKARDRLERLLTPALASAVDKIAPPSGGAQGG